MAQQGAAQAQAHDQEAVEESQTYVLGPDDVWIALRVGKDGWMPVETDLDGMLDSEGTDELRIVVLGEDVGYDLREANAEQFYGNLGAGIIEPTTYDGRTLRATDQDEFRTCFLTNPCEKHGVRP